MGCAGSSGSAVAQAGPPVDVPELRRRLSIGVDVEEPPPDNEEDCALVVQLDNTQLLELLSDNNDGRKWSLGSETDKDLHKRPSFSQKTVCIKGDQVVNPNQEGIGYACKKGMKPEAPNQDSFAVVKVENEFSIYAVFDGHGSKGHDVSNFVKDQLPKLLVLQTDMATNPKEALMAAFKQTQGLIERATEMQKLNAEKSGCTASVILHDHISNQLHIGHVGDSRCVLAKRTKSTESDTLEAHDLTVDHKPNDPKERARIEANGGHVVFDGFYNHRVYAKGKRYPGLNMSRALGDLLGYYDAGISSDPDVKSHDVATAQKADKAAKSDPAGQSETAEGTNIVPNAVPEAAENGGREKLALEQPDADGAARPLTSTSSDPEVHSVQLDPAVDLFVLLCSDGVWEFMSSQEAVEVCAKFPQSKAMQAAEALSKSAWDAWQQVMGGCVVDDITALLVHLQPVKQNTNAATAAST